MNTYKRLVMVFFYAISCCACSTDNLQQIGYFAVQNFGAYQCQKAMASDCNAKPNYDEYQRQRGEIQKP